MRVDYSGPAVELTEDACAAGWRPMFESWLAAAIEGGVSEPNAMVLATIGDDGLPATRTVLCKGLSDTGIAFYTNYESGKGRHLAARPVASATFVWASIARQVTFRGDVSRVPEAVSDEYWEQRPRGARLGAWASEQSNPIGSRTELDAKLSQVEERFAKVDDIPRPLGWGGFEITPRTVEFWQGRTNRLHDRIRLTRTTDGWDVTRLQP
ncbi:pyridoxamine 5'-phosphate oxidase [Smaragdicoccus niigatensis]